MINNKITIITACFNPGRTLRDAVDSLLSQNYSNVEFIIIDGGSSDGTVDYIYSLRDCEKFRVISESDRGIYDALNKGVNLSTGDIIGFLHSDDLLSRPTVLSEIEVQFQNKKTDAVYGDLVYVARDNLDRIIRYWRSGEYKAECLKYGWMPPHPALYIRRSIYEKAKLKNGTYFDIKMKCSADYNFMLRLFTKHCITVAYYPEILVKMRLGGTSNRSFAHIIRKSCEDFTAIRENNIGGFATLLLKNLRKGPQFYWGLGAFRPSGRPKMRF